MPSLDLAISSPRKYFRYPKSFILKVLSRKVLMAAISFELLPMIIGSSTYTKITIKEALVCLINMELSELEWLKLLDTSAFDRQAYHCLLDCLSP